MKKKKWSQLWCMVWALSFLLGIHKGKIALWRNGEEKPMRVFPYSASSLPEAAQEQLKKGIHFESFDELKKLAEAYLS